MGIKLKPPYNIDNTPIYKIENEEGVLGRANRNGTILIRPDLSPAQEKETLAHEKKHLKQFELFNKSNGEKGLDYADDHVMWNGKRYERRNGKIRFNGKWMVEGDHNFPWEPYD